MVCEVVVRLVRGSYVILRQSCWLFRWRQGKGSFEEIDERSLARILGSNDEDAEDVSVKRVESREQRDASAHCITTYLYGVGSFLLRTRRGLL